MSLPTHNYSGSVEAMRDKRSQSDNWKIGDALVTEVPTGASRVGFERVRRAAESAGVVPLSVSALRQYRDTAIAWPAHTRVPGVSFSAHRAAKSAPEPSKLLEGLATLHGAGSVSVKMVERALTVGSGSVPAAPAPAAAGAVTLTGADTVALVVELAWRFESRGSKMVDEVLSAAAASVARLVELAAEMDTRAKSHAAKSAAWSGPAKSKSASALAPAAAPRKRGSVRGL